MPTIDLTTLTIEELTELEEDIKRELERRKQEERAALLAQAQELAKRHGISLDELLRPPKKQRALPPLKYRNPDNPAQTWAGRGKKPAWVQEKLDAGITLEDLEVAKATLSDAPERLRRRTESQT